MVQTKHQKSKPKKQPHVKKHGKQADISDLRGQLDALGLKIIQVTADGNCFFRALADQLEGNEEEHQKYRAMVVKYIRENREMFEPFIEDEVPFEEYCESMEKDGTWAGHMELQAASLVTHSNICIHRNMSPRWYIHNFESHRARMIHLSYHDGEHYNSVRLKEDPSDGPARTIVIKADASLQPASDKAKVVVTKSKGGHGRTNIDEGSVKMVMVGTGVQDPVKVEEVLQQLDGDVDAAIEFLIAERGAEDFSVGSGELVCLPNTSHGDMEDVSTELPKEEVVNATLHESPSCNNIKQTQDNKISQKDDKKIARNKACPCGSKKKYKACCGSVSGRSSAKIVLGIDQQWLPKVGTKVLESCDKRW
ncbi:OTU domain, partial [Dillenia turbinata]